MSDLQRGALEAILMVAPEPVPVANLAAAIDLPEAETEALLHAMVRQYADDQRGFELREAGGGWRFYSHPRYSEIVAGVVTSGQSSRLSAQALETLAVIAYRQPCTRAQIASIRGVEVDSVVRTLVTRGLVEQVGTTAATGASLYSTTALFLEKMGMNSLDDLAPLAPSLPDDADLDEVEKELR